MTVLKFSAAWCAPCTKFSPIFDEVSAEMSEKADFKEFNVDVDTDIAYEYGIYSIPTVVFVDNEQELGRVSGFQTKEALIQEIERYF